MKWNTEFIESILAFSNVGRGARIIKSAIKNDYPAIYLTHLSISSPSLQGGIKLLKIDFWEHLIENDIERRHIAWSRELHWLLSFVELLRIRAVRREITSALNSQPWHRTRWQIRPNKTINFGDRDTHVWNTKTYIRLFKW